MPAKMQDTTIITSSKTKTCHTCGESKPIAKFKRRLTLAQTRAMLKQPSATTRYITTSKICQECRKKTKRAKPLTIKQVRTKITSGDMHPIRGEMLIDQKREAIPLGRSKVMRQYWQDKKSEPYKKFKRHLQDQINRFGNRHYASTHLQDATRLQNSWNFQEAKRIMRDLLEQAQEQLKTGTFVPNEVNIASLIKPLPQGEKQ